MSRGENGTHIRSTTCGAHTHTLLRNSDAPCIRHISYFPVHAAQYGRLKGRRGHKSPGWRAHAHPRRIRAIEMRTLLLHVWPRSNGEKAHAQSPFRRGNATERGGEGAASMAFNCLTFMTTTTTTTLVELPPAPESRFAAPPTASGQRMD